MFKNESENIGYKFIVTTILGITTSVLYHWIKKKNKQVWGTVFVCSL